MAHCQMFWESPQMSWEIGEKGKRNSLTFYQAMVLVSLIWFYNVLISMTHKPLI